MDTLKVIRERRSIRDYLPDQPPKEMILDILADGHRAPSGSNLQPWEFIAVAGGRLKDLREHLINRHRRRPIEYPSSGSKKDPVPANIWQRQKDLGREIKTIVESMGKQHLSFIVEGSLAFYGAPVAVLALVDRSIGGDCLIDMGLAVGNIILSATDRGLGSCPIGMANMYGEDIIEFLGLEKRKRLLLAVALGYPREGSLINVFKSSRAPLEEIIRWME